MLNRQQIALKLGLDVLGVEIKEDNYRYICNLVYLAEQRGINISPGRIEFDKTKRIAYSPGSYQHYEGRHNLLDDVKEIEESLPSWRKGRYSGWFIDTDNKRKLERLKRDVEDKGIESLLEITAMN